MLRWILASTCTIFLLGQAEDKKSAATQPASRPAESPSSLRKPAQANILKGLLGRHERPRPILPQSAHDAEDGVDPVAGAIDPEGHPLLLEGTFLIERPGRLVYEDGRANFALQVDGGDQGVRTLELCPNQLLEAMEREAKSGFTEFIVSAEITRYRGRNYLLLRKILRRVDHGNLGP